MSRGTAHMLRLRFDAKLLLCPRSPGAFSFSKVERSLRSDVFRRLGSPCSVPRARSKAAASPRAPYARRHSHSSRAAMAAGSRFH